MLFCFGVRVRMSSSMDKDRTREVGIMPESQVLAGVALAVLAGGYLRGLRFDAEFQLCLHGRNPETRGRIRRFAGDGQHERLGSYSFQRLHRQCRLLLMENRPHRMGPFCDAALRTVLVRGYYHGPALVRRSHCLRHWRK